MAAQSMANKTVADKTWDVVSDNNISNLLQGPQQYMGTKDPGKDIINMVMTPIIQGIVIIGLAIGGLVAADKMSIHLSEATVVAGEAAAGHATRAMSNSGRSRTRSFFNNIRQSATGFRAQLRPPILMPTQRGGVAGPALTQPQAQKLATAAAKNADQARLKVASLQTTQQRTGTSGPSATLNDRAALTQAKGNFAAANRDAVLSKDELDNITRMKTSVAQTESTSTSSSIAPATNTTITKVVSTAPVSLGQLTRNEHITGPSASVKPSTQRIGQFSPTPVTAINSISGTNDQPARPGPNATTAEKAAYAQRMRNQALGISATDSSRLETAVKTESSAKTGDATLATAANTNNSAQTSPSRPPELTQTFPINTVPASLISRKALNANTISAQDKNSYYQERQQRDQARFDTANRKNETPQTASRGSTSVNVLEMRREKIPDSSLPAAIPYIKNGEYPQAA